jgi:hypothetical protein
LEVVRVIMSPRPFLVFRVWSLWSLKLSMERDSSGASFSGAVVVTGAN